MQPHGLPAGGRQGDDDDGMQGLEVGEGLPLGRMVGTCDRKTESRAPNSLYVLVTRAKGEEVLGLDHAVTVDQLRKLGTGVKPAQLRAELARLHAAAQLTEDRYRAVYPDFGSRGLYLKLLEWLALFCRRKHGNASRQPGGTAEWQILGRCTALLAAVQTRRAVVGVADMAPPGQAARRQRQPVPPPAASQARARPDASAVADEDSQRHMRLSQLFADAT
jgi:hypothetical protein